MSKKEKVPPTFEEIARESARKEAKSKLFNKTFTRALAFFIAFALVYWVSYIAFTPATSAATATGSSSGTSSTSSKTSSGSSSSGTSSGSGSSSSSSGTSTNTSSTGSGSSSTGSAAGSSAAASGELSSSSSVADVVSYFNTAINKVKPNAKQITLNSETNSKAGSVSGLPSTLNSLADKLISANMGTKDLSKLDADKVNATTTEAKNAMFPVENESWSSQLTADDVESSNVAVNGNTYTITLNIKADDASADTAHGVGHNGKVFSVVMPTVITANAGAAASIIKEVKTGHSNGKIVVDIDKTSGNVTHANYYFVWTLSVKALGSTVTMPFGLEKDFTIAW